MIVNARATMPGMKTHLTVLERQREASAVEYAVDEFVYTKVANRWKSVAVIERIKSHLGVGYRVENLDTGRKFHRMAGQLRRDQPRAGRPSKSAKLSHRVRVAVGDVFTTRISADLGCPVMVTEDHNPRMDPELPLAYTVRTIHTDKEFYRLRSELRMPSAELLAALGLTPVAPPPIAPLPGAPANAPTSQGREGVRAIFERVRNRQGSVQR